MTSCEQLRAALAAGRPLLPDARAHAAECEGCSELISAHPLVARHLLAHGGRPSDHAPGDAPTMLAALNLELQRERGVRAFLRSRSTAIRVTGVSLAFAGIGFAHTASLLRPDVAAYPPERFALELALLCVLAFVSTSLALRPLHRTRVRPAFGFVAVAMAAAIPIVAAFAAPAHAAHPASLAGAGADLPARALGCFVYGALWSIPVVLLFTLMDRSPSRGSILLAAGTSTLAANLALWLHCPITHGVHIALGHATIGFVLVAAGAALTAITRRQQAAPTLRPKSQGRQEGPS